MKLKKQFAEFYDEITIKDESEPLKEKERFFKKILKTNFLIN